MKLFVANLQWDTIEDDLMDHFSQAGKVLSAKIMTDRETNRSRGFGFVEMATDEQSQLALKTLNNTELKGRKIVVNEARERAPRPQRERSNEY